MARTQVESFATVITALAVVIVLILTGVPLLARLLFRRRLEAIRDDGVDALLDGHLRQEPPVENFLSAVDRAGRYARWMTLARSAAILRAFVDLGCDPDEMLAPETYSELTEPERAIVAGLEGRVETAFRSYLIWGSPLGWAIAPLVLIASRVRPDGKLAKTEDALPVLARETMCPDQVRHPTVALWAPAGR
jgi:hypothetical protein